MHLKQILAPALALMLAAPPASAGKAPSPDAAFRTKLNKDKEIAHALSRLTYGPRPGDIDQLRRIGLKKWIDQQLNPDRIAENPVLEERLAPLESLRMTNAEIVANYPPPQMILAVATGRMRVPDDPQKKALYERLAARYRERIQKKDGDKDPGNNPLQPAARTPLRDLLAPADLRALRDGTADERAAVLSKLEPVKLGDVLFSLNPNQRRGLIAIAPTEIRRKMLANAAPQQVLAHDLVEAKLYRAIYSNRQLAEILSDFWYNHFNVFLDKGADRFLVTSYERDAIRPHVLGKFRDILQATAEHPAMLWYLDNWQSVSDAPSARPRRAGPANKRKRGLNENYARELLELHTLGVDGGYTQKDIVEVARCFTGWTIREPYRGGGFEFNARLHDNGEKVVLGKTIPAGGGKDDGLAVLDILSAHPSTARHISHKLAQKFVSDNPPQSLVDAMAKTFTSSGGDIRKVLRTMLDSREFWSEGAYRAKVKSPLDMVVSSVRATGADVNFAFGLAARIGELGQPLYRKQEPTGYYDFYEEWVNSAGLVARMNFALQLTGNQMPGSKVDIASFGADPIRIAGRLLPVELSAQTADALRKSENNEPAAIAALVLGSPEFQRK